MIESFKKTKSYGTELAIYLDEDDPRLSEYDKYDCKVFINPRINVAQAHNWLAETLPGFDYYMPINDDILFLTPEWDVELIKTIEERGGGWGIAHGRDYNGFDYFKPFPTFGLVSGNIVKKLGHIYPLELKALFGDTYLNDLGRAIGKLFYCPSVLIEHVAQTYNKDDVRISDTFDKQERKAYAHYIDTKLDNDVHKLFEAIINSYAPQKVTA